MQQSGHVRLWKYRVTAEMQEKFVGHYHMDGTWAHLFRQARGYLGTQLWRDSVDSEIFYTADHWLDQAAFDEFLGKFRSQYEKLDAEFADLTVTESFLGAGNHLRRD